VTSKLSSRWLGAAALSASLLLVTSACSDPASGDSSSGDKQSVSIVGFSILKTANKQLIADFKKTDAGKNVDFKESYGASGDQARAVIAGLKADEVHPPSSPT
jgi:sulfate transport system substrate-binding protein